MIREVVIIDPGKCDGCGQCIPACHEGAIRLVDGKARLVSDNLCDGLGACLGHCPRGAITIVRRDAEAFDEAAAARHLARPAGEHPEGSRPQASGCPSSRFVSLGSPGRDAGNPSGSTGAGPTGGVSAPLDPAQQPVSPASRLTHWPVQLGLLPAAAPVLKGARLLIAADCVPVAYPGFHENLLRGRAVAIGCPKFDDTAGYLAKLTEMIRSNDLAGITVARMEVPCCGGILMLALEARRLSGRDIPVVEIVIGTGGELLGRREHPAT